MKSKSDCIGILFVAMGLLMLWGCGAPPSANLDPTMTSVPTFIADTPTAVPAATSTLGFVASPAVSLTPTELAIDTQIAYVQDDALLVTHVSGGHLLDTRIVIQSEVREGILELGWSPSGEFLAFSMYVIPDGFHTFVVNVEEGGTPVDLDFGNVWAWSPDSRSLAFEHEAELWVYSVDNGRSRRLTNYRDEWRWSTPPARALAFTPAGDALVAAGGLSDDQDRRGNTLYRLYRVPIAGSASVNPPGNLRSLTDEISGRMPLALRFSPDGENLALITSGSTDNCATWASYFVGNADGSDLRELPMASLAALGGPDGEMYFFGDSLVWTPESDGLWMNGSVTHCRTSPSGVVGGPQVSRVTLDGVEHETILGEFTHLSFDRTGMLLGVVNLEPFVPRVQILGRDGHLVLDLGEGALAALQP